MRGITPVSYTHLDVYKRQPQVGILKRIVVIDIGEGPIILVNPEILETAGEQTGEEGLSLIHICGD